MSSKRRRFSGQLKAKVALEALQGDRTLQEIASKYQVHPNQVGAWKRQAIEGLGEVFSKGAEGRVLDPMASVGAEELRCTYRGSRRSEGGNTGKYSTRKSGRCGDQTG